MERLQHTLRRLRDERFSGSAQQLARALSLSQSAVSQLISGRTTPSLGTLRRIARLSGLTIGALLDGAGALDAFPHRALAAQIARDGGLPEAAIQAVLASPATDDLPVLAWLKRIEATSILGAVASGG